MDENELRVLLGCAVASEPGLGPVVDNAIRAGLRIRRRRRVLGAVGCVAAVAMVAGVVPALGRALAVQQPPTMRHSIVSTPSELGPSIPADLAPTSQPTSLPTPGRRPAATPSTASPDNTYPNGSGATVYAVDSDGYVYGLNAATGTATAPVTTNGGLVAFAMAPDGGTAYALVNDGLIVPVNTVSRRTGKVIPVPSALQVGGMAIAPDGRTIYLADDQNNRVLAISVRTGTVVATVPTGAAPGPMAFSLSGTTGYVIDKDAETVTAFSTVNHHALATIPVGKDAMAIATAPTGTVYVVNASSDTVTPIDPSTNTAGPAVRVGMSPEAIVFSATTAYVVDTGSASVTPIDLASSRALRAIPAGREPFMAAITPSGSAVYVVNNESDFVTVIDTGSNRVAASVRVGTGQGGLAVTADGSTVFVDVRHTAVPISTASNRAGTPIRLSAVCCVEMLAP
jgi:YVTN family beta-propeller protein